MHTLIQKNKSGGFFMETRDTLCLLKECDSGSKMAVSAIDEILDKTENDTLKQVLTSSKKHHEELGNKLHALLLQYHSKEKEPNPMAKSMSWMKTNMKMNMDKSDATIADLITDGCNMGVKSLYKYLNQYSEANAKSKDICKELIRIEEKLREDLRDYL
jgi:hypothetical protein